MIYKGSIWEEANRLGKRWSRAGQLNPVAVLLIRALREELGIENEACAQLAEYAGAPRAAYLIRQHGVHRLRCLEPIMEPVSR